MSFLTRNTKKRNDFKQGNHTVKLALLLTILWFNIILNATVIFLRSRIIPFWICVYKVHY